MPNRLTESNYNFRFNFVFVRTNLALKLTSVCVNCYV